MRLLILLAGLALAANAFAGDDRKDPTRKADPIRELDKSSPQISAAAEETDATDAKESASKTRAQDYNSSRSNTTTAIDADDDGDSIETEECTDSVDNDCTGVTDEKPANHNTTRTK